ncbi:hypothetical protein [Aquimarina aggregata]|uniref:hypothetical protein n=1 Tax=Aquimarina aggregata TaxID=1642818 RepID=UPI00248FF69F|nr:hypothetical protein [Aquimarina aggregata]
MTENKRLEKLWDKISKETFKSNGWKHVSGFNYIRSNDHLYTFTIIKHRNKPNTISANLNVKFIFLDDILWKILNMPENSNSRFSLRVNGAFTLYSKSILEWQQEISLTNPEEDFIQIYAKVSKVFGRYNQKLTDINSFLEFIINDKNSLENSIEKNLYLTGKIYQGKINEAVNFLNLNKKETGGIFCNGKFFYELALDYCNNLEQKNC